MKKIIYIFLLFLSPLAFVNVYSQEEDEETEKTEKDFNAWSIELNVGQNKAVRPFTEGYYSSDPTKYFNISGISHYNLGVRYMLSNRFGLKLSGAYDKVSNEKNNQSLEFEGIQYRIGLEGVFNLRDLFNFDSFTKRIGLLLHAGPYVSQYTPQLGSSKDVSEDNGGVMIGMTPQLRISNRIVFTGDFTVQSSVRQHYNWDGMQTSVQENLTGLMYNLSAGLTFYLGGKDIHADWYSLTSADRKLKDDNGALRKRLDDLEGRMQDTDRDGVVDYLDTEPNTIAGITVDTKGRTIDRNNNGIADELEAKGRDGADGQTSLTVEKQDAIKILVERGYVNVFFDVNMDDPNTGSTNNVYQIIQFLRSYPEAKAKLIGFADVRGEEAKNQDLSTRRAQKVLNILTASGIDANRLTIAGNGVDTSYPADTKIGLDLARRVSVVLE